MELKILGEISQLERRVRQVGEGFYNSASVTSANGKGGGSVSYDLFDLLLVGALTESSVLLTGRTDSGKTDLAKIVMTALFCPEEEGWHRLDMDIDFGRDQYVDVDFAVIRNGKKVSEGMFDALPYLRMPGLIVDEWNRAPPKIANKMLHFFDKDVNIGGGVRAKVGYTLGDGKGNGGTYSFLVAAINEGEEYEGTFPIDKAARRRAVIEIPLDNFAPTIQDRERINASRRGRLYPQPADSLSLEQRMTELLAVKSAVEQIPVDGSANHFLLYLQSMDHCVRSQTGSKLGIKFDEGICTKAMPQQVTAAQSGKTTSGGGACHFYTFHNNMCPAVSAISEGTSINLLRVARGFAALRAAKLGMAEGDVSVYAQDLAAAFPFVAYSKLGLSQPWVDKHFQGSLWLAVNGALAEAERKLGHAYTALGSEIEAVSKGRLSEDGLQKITAYCEGDDPWFMKSLLPYLSGLKNDPEFKIAVAKARHAKLL